MFSYLISNCYGRREKRKNKMVDVGIALEHTLIRKIEKLTYTPYLSDLDEFEVNEEIGKLQETYKNLTGEYYILV